ncbi:MAG: PmeII family type II restriction endonuclease [Candidatus Loosdrechtia sp.]|uniref:PmeII family type II restriction endonuclease n=1 Tax=Candidatus Loosdrechtia sp. TaxID=3101272 RepID=UPI003A682051|nr:MAG: PmeII family type II restriction endonuclease [Candidatus Jettenia sp. AMX2]
MGIITEKEITNYIEKNIESFHRRRLESLCKLRLKIVLKRKNPYLFKAKNITTAGELVKGLLDAHLSSQEEGVFGDFLEGLAVFINNKVYGGHKSSSEGIDLEFEKDSIVYIVSIKSGPNWGNSGQIKKMIENFKKAKQRRRTYASKTNIVAVNGCCYGKLKREDKGEYLKKCGQSFWRFISGDDNLYTEIIEPLGHKAKEKNEEFLIEYGNVVNKFTKQFMDEFCSSDGSKILWDRIVKLNSGSEISKNSWAF